METISHTSARKKFSDAMKQICNNDETAYLLRSPKNALRLKKAIGDIEAGKYTEKSLAKN